MTTDASPVPKSERSPRTLADQVYVDVRRDIVSGRLAPGARVVELEIAASMGTSQGPVREALQRLEREGLVARQQHSATFVTPIARDEMYEIFCIRRLIEGFAARRTAVRITDAQIDHLHELVERMREAGRRDDMLAMTDDDLRFHRLICQWSESATLLREWDPLYSQIQRFVVATNKEFFGTVLAVAETHVPIVQAFRARDVDMVSRVVQEHVMLIWSMSGQETATVPQAKEPPDAAGTLPTR